MNVFGLPRLAFSLGIAAAFLAGCGGGSQLPTQVPTASSDHRHYRHSEIFKYTGGEQYFTVPASVTEVRVAAVGAPGGGPAEGLGGKVAAAIPVQPGEQLAIFVGGMAYENRSEQRLGGFNGGGNSPGPAAGYGGGGASDVRQGGDALADRVVVAGGGGGAGVGYRAGGSGGAGGNTTGASGANGGYQYGGAGGGGGTQSSGGSGGAGGDGSTEDGGSGESGTLGAGGDGGAGGSSYGSYASGSGGGGGGGYYGGGGGGAGGGFFYDQISSGGGGGGGSSYAEASATHVRMYQGANGLFNGSVAIRW